MTHLVQTTTRFALTACLALGLAGCQEDLTQEKTAFEGMVKDWSGKMDGFKKTQTDLLAKVSAVQAPEALGGVKTAATEAVKGVGSAIDAAQKAIESSKSAFEMASKLGKKAGVQTVVDAGKTGVSAALTAVSGGLEKANGLVDDLQKQVEGAKTAMASPKDIVDTAVAAGSFNTLAALLTEAGLVATLKGAGPFTVFAPTDEAFAQIDAKAVAALKADKKKLAQVLTYHVVAGKVDAAAVTAMKDGSKVKTVSGKTFTLGLKGGVKVDAANVVKTDIMCSNGIIHVIDAVVMPK